VIDADRLKEHGEETSDVLDEILRALQAVYQLVDRRVANEVAVGKQPWELSDGDWKAGRLTYAEIRVKTRRTA